MIPLFTSEQIRKADEYAIEKLQIPGVVLMENASISIVNGIKQNYDLIKGISSIGVIAGKGNNGGDAFAVARHLINEGYSVNIISVAKKDELKGDALINFSILNVLIPKVNNANLIFYKSPKDLKKLKDCNLIIDGLLGTGTKGELREPYKSIIEYVNELQTYKVSIDLPSGLNLEKSTASSIFNSDLTVTLAEYKSGLFYGKGYEFAGKVTKGSIGIGNEYFESQSINEYLIEPEDALMGLPKKNKVSHKYSNGKVLAIVGSGKYPGAASLVMKSLFNSGTGAAILAFPKSIRDLVAGNIGESVFELYSNTKEYLDFNALNEIEDKIEWCDVLALGSGIGREDETLEAVSKIMKKYTSKKMVIDADAIYAIGKLGYSKYNLKNKIFTPHHSEFAQLINIELDELESNILNYGRDFVKKTESFLVLKGAPTIIFLPNNDVLINSAGNAGMAKFGSGDVLTGVITGLLSQSKNIEGSIISGVYLHSLSADLLLENETEFGVTATKIMENLPNAINFLRNSII